MSWLSRLSNVFRGDRLDRDLEEELRFHREQRAADFVRRGLDAGHAQAEAERKFGDDLRLREQSREVKLLPWLESLWRDVRYGARMLAKNPVVTSAAVLSLALAIGACTSAFSLMDALVLRPLPVRDPEGLVFLGFLSDRPGATIDDTFSYPELLQLREVSQGRLDLLTAGSARLRDIVYEGTSERVRGQYVSGNAFDTLGVKPAMGRLIAPEDDRGPGERQVAVIGYDYWTRLGRDPNIVGKRLVLDNVAVPIIGVMEPGFTGVEPGLKCEVWIPNAMQNPQAFKEAGWAWFRILGRLKPGVNREQAKQILQRGYKNRERHMSKVNPLVVESAAGGVSNIRRDFARPLTIVAIVAGLILLIAGSNVANLLVARAAARQREMALRLSIGAGRGRLIQQMLVESGLLSIAACAIGICFALAMGPAVVSRLLPAGNPAYLDLSLNWKVLGVVAFIAALATSLFGLVPALRSSSVSPNEVLKTDGGRHAQPAGLLRPLVAAQVAFSVTVLFTGGLLLISFQKLTSIDIGFAKSGLLFFELDALGERGEPAAQQLLESVRQIPEVRGASYSSWALLNGNRWRGNVGAPGQGETYQTHLLDVSPGYFDTVGMRLLSGREFSQRDLDPSASVAIVNETFAHGLFPGTNPVGQRFVRQAKLVEIVGLVADAKYLELRAAAPPTAFLPMRGKGGATLSVRIAGDATKIMPAIRAHLKHERPSLRIGQVISQAALLDNLILRERLLALLSAFFAGVALLLAAIGLYGVLSYAVVRRTKEIGIRMALGARQLSVMRLVIGEVALVVCVGIAAGLGGGLGLSRFVASLLYSTSPRSTSSVAIPLLCLMVAAVLAALPPAIRAVRLDPMTALRQD